MLKAIVGGLIGAMVFGNVAMAQTCASYPYTFANMSTADANQVNSNFNTIMSCANTLLAPLSSPDFTGLVSIGTPTPTAALDVSNGLLTLVLGADSGSTTGTRTVNTQKVARIGSYPYGSGGTVPVALAILSNTSTSNNITIGGGTSIMSAANLISFNTTDASTTTPTGTERMRITSTGNVGIGTAAPAQALEVNGEVKIDSFGAATSAGVCVLSGVLSTCSSSIRYKENVKDAPFGLTEVTKMRPVTFKWKGRDENDLGLIAEEVAKINPLFVTYKDGKIEGVKYAQLTAVLVNAIKELKGANDTQAAQIAQLQNQVSELQRKAGIRTAVNDSPGQRTVSVIGRR